jgi:hypothetical protein
VLLSFLFTQDNILFERAGNTDYYILIGKNDFIEKIMEKCYNEIMKRKAKDGLSFTE